MNHQRILVTGADGFVGRHLCRELLSSGYTVRAAVRKRRTDVAVDPSYSSRLEVVETGDLTHFAGWPALVKNTQHIVHLVARTHVTDEFGSDAIQLYRGINVDVTRRLAKAAAQSDVQRFVYLSSIKAVANASSEPLCEHAPNEPVDSYGITKLEAERELKKTLAGTATSYTIFRPPLVYGEGVKGNFVRLMRLVQRRVPLPRVENARSMVHVSNLASAIQDAIISPRAANEVFHVGDGEPISTTKLVQAMAQGFELRPTLLPMPKKLLMQFGNVLGRGAEIQRFVGSLSLSSDKLQACTEWRPMITTSEGVARTCRAFANHPWVEQDAQWQMDTRRAA